MEVQAPAERESVLSTFLVGCKVSKKRGLIPKLREATLAYNTWPVPGSSAEIRAEVEVIMTSLPTHTLPRPLFKRVERTK